MNEEEIRDEARKAANRSQFMSNHVYDHKSYEDGFYEGMSQALRQYNVSGQREQLVKFSRHIQKYKNEGLDFDCVEREVDHYLTNCH